MSTIDPNSPLGIIQYYGSLLIIQYLGKAKAYATITSTAAPAIMPQVSVQQITFSAIAASGAFVLSYDGTNSPSINWNDSASTIQTKLQTIGALSAVTVTGSIADQSLSITFVSVIPPALLLNVESDTLLDGSSNAVGLTVTEIDQTLPIAVQNAFNMTGSNPAMGVQLDVIGAYCGVTRTGSGPFGSITLDDADFLTLIQFAIVQNASGSSLAQIESNLNMFFPGQFIVTDYKNMFMSYLLSSSLGSKNLFYLLVAENLIPHPMGVGITVIVPPDITQFFGFSTYQGLNNSAKPFNAYADFHTDWFFLSYADGF